MVLCFFILVFICLLSNTEMGLIFVYVNHAYYDLTELIYWFLVGFFYRFFGILHVDNHVICKRRQF